MDVTKIRIDPEKLKDARGNRSTTEVARSVGITRSQLWNIENDKSRPSADVLAKLCSLYEVDISHLVTN